jgi:hypothetical protein
MSVKGRVFIERCMSCEATRVIAGPWNVSVVWCDVCVARAESAPVGAGVSLAKAGDPVRPSAPARPVSGVVELRGDGWVSYELRAVIEARLRGALRRSEYFHASTLSWLLHCQ